MCQAIFQEIPALPLRRKGRENVYFIKYDYTADGKPIMVEVTEEVAEFLREDKRLTENAERKER